MRLPILTIERVAPFFWEADAFKVKGSAGLRGCRRRGRIDNYRLAAFTGTPGNPRNPAWALVNHALG